MPPPDSTDPFDAVAEDYDRELDRGLRLTGAGKDYFAEGRITWVERRVKWGPDRDLAVIDFG